MRALRANHGGLRSNRDILGVGICFVAAWAALAIIAGLLLGFPDPSNPADLAGYLGFTLAFGGSPGAAAYAIYWRTRHPRAGEEWTKKSDWSLVRAVLIGLAVVVIYIILTRL